ncbi:hypothetical protein IV203_026559 [Nitzschia inconspicua]|uniref:Uncharacterized protein n=1 Tax=Nitzschia inconspicua TaxID=303405 RepID=A0A9K3LIT5_9STRA|nr:hypothetical protein IV203_026559 [Nitzschia inconspicua]
MHIRFTNVLHVLTVNVYWLLLQQSSNKKYTTAAFSRPQQPSLSQVYRDIAHCSNQITNDWPHSQDFCRDYLIYNVTHQYYQLPTFPDGNGPLGVFGMLYQNEKTKAIMNECHGLFEQFCKDVQSTILKDDAQMQDDFMDHWVLNTPPESDHISVAILQEHPTFLKDPIEREQWKPIPSHKIQKLAKEYSRKHAGIPSPNLELDALLWTPDGAMIAGFIETSDDGYSSFEELRIVSKTTALEVLGSSTLSATRPKKLIHATVGRVLGLPPTTTSKVHSVKEGRRRQKQELSALAQTYNTLVLPDTVSKIRRESDGIFELQQLSLLRNQRWMLFEYKEYGSWNTGQVLES